MPPLNVRDQLAGIGLVPAPVKVLSHHSELDHEITGKVFGLGFAPLFAPQAKECLLIIAHDDAGVRSADKKATILSRLGPQCAY